jgi:hypothetical protein
MLYRLDTNFLKKKIKKKNKRKKYTKKLLFNSDSIFLIKKKLNDIVEGDKLLLFKFLKVKKLYIKLKSTE